MMLADKPKATDSRHFEVHAAHHYFGKFGCVNFATGSRHELATEEAENFASVNVITDDCDVTLCCKTLKVSW